MNIATQNPLGPCDEFAFDIGDLIDGTLSAQREQVVQMHVHGCSRCRPWYEELRAVDAALAEALPRPGLSNEFLENLQSRLASLQQTRRLEAVDALSAAAREYEQMIASLRGWRWQAILNGTATAAVAGCAYAALHALAPTLAAVFKMHDASALVHLSAPLAIGLAALAAVSARRFGPALQGPMLG